MAWSTRNSYTGKNTFAVEATHNPIAYESKEMAQMRTKLGLVLKHVTRDANKVNAMNY